LAAERAARQRLTSPQRVIFEKTAAYIAAVRSLGCRRPRQQETSRTGEELAHYENDRTQQQDSRRGYSSPPTCQGRIIYHEYPDPVHKGAAPRAYLRSAPSVAPVAASLSSSSQL
jgi:hypothetical protein